VTDVNHRLPIGDAGDINGQKRPQRKPRNL
jgi:hypothetical protein